ncbi:zinc finger protein-like [Tropilaelaps mercedesae]|uniref:Zinc finger protein-like n=1 Tax=Tropilaelaps mercedesae TaxID=418985 RepID=A0A1V9XQY9_9ACAR|nr:zinc finger protein-like [Tropilaelaps mercedesae]
MAGSDMLDYTDIGTLDDLEMYHREGKTYMCLLCSYQTEHSYTMRRHVLQKHSSHRPYKCTVCERPFGRKDHLTKHMKARHGTERPFSCSLCDKSFATNGAFQQHLNSPTHLMRCNAVETIINDSIGASRLDTSIKIELANKDLGNAG